LGDEEVVDWAIADLERGQGRACCGLQFYILTWSPLDKADRRAKAIIEEGGGDGHDVWLLLGGYEDSPWPPRWDRLQEIAFHPTSRASAIESLQKILDAQAEAGAKEAVELLALLREKKLPAPPEPPLPSRLRTYCIILAAVAGLGLAVTLLAIRRQRTHHSRA
jgi:hypothetical protein